MRDIDEAKIYEAFGLEIPEGAREQEPAEPAGDTPEPDDPETPVEVKTPAQEQEAMTMQQRRENAARRRQQEQQEKIDQAVRAALATEQQKHAAEMSNLFAKAGLKNTFTGQAITTMDELDSFQRQFAAAKLQQDLKAGSLTKEALDQAISAHPVVQQAAQVIRDAEASRQRQEDAAARQRIDIEVAKIHQIDPSISSVQDLLNAANAKAFYEYAKKGLTLSEAYMLANREKLEQQKTEAARQQALSAARGKDHLRGPGAVRGAGTAAVPAEDMAMFRVFMPNASEAEIQAFYNKHRNNH